MPGAASPANKVHRINGTDAGAAPTQMSAEGRIFIEREYRLEEEWQSRVRSLERWVCKLLIKNEQLRMSLAMARAPDRDGQDAIIRRPWERAIQADEP